MQHFINAALKYQQSVTHENVELKMAKSRLVEIQSRKNNLLAAIEQGIFTPSTAARLKELEANEDELKIISAAYPQGNLPENFRQKTYKPF